MEVTTIYLEGGIFSTKKMKSVEKGKPSCATQEWLVPDVCDMDYDKDTLGTVSNNQNGNLGWFLPWRVIPWLWKRVLHLVWALYYVYIVVEMTLNMAK